MTMPDTNNSANSSPTGSQNSFPNRPQDRTFANNKPGFNNQRSGGSNRNNFSDRRPQNSNINFSRPPYGHQQEKFTGPTNVLDGVVRVIPLGGVEEVGRNMTMFEIGEDIIVVDMGFSFKDDATPGVDYILPNTQYLEERKHKIRGVLITHGHLDHIGAIPYLIERF